MGSQAFPTIDIVGLSGNGPSEGVDTVARQIRSACVDTGFFYISNHGISEDLIAETLAANRSFHARPLAEKLKLKLNRWHRGFEPFAASVLVSSTRFDPAKSADQLESYVVRQEVSADDPDYGVKELMGPNLWPDDPAFRDTVSRYDQALRALGLKLLPAFSVAVGESPNFFSDVIVPPTTALRLIHYSPSPKHGSDDLHGIQPHTDYGFITILAQDDVGGLDVQTVDGNWVEAPAVPGTFLVNIGDALARWTNDVFNSTPHRVINKSDQHSRYSLAMFFDPHVDTVLRCLEGFKDDAAPQKHEPVRFGEYLLGRLDANHPTGMEADGPVG
ncbi:MAG: isopenicillin N synthase family oxygenase [Alphaproteobacteria bacterium]|nr:isopenicillin N synthase family oxygenase [Alphaproteobacteria bacterium]